MGWIEDRAEEAAVALQVTLGRRLGGRYNAWLASGDGGDFVIKPHPPDAAHSFDRIVEAVSVLPALRQRGYPIPHHLALVTVGKLTVTMQELVAGSGPVHLELSTAKQLVDLMVLQADVGRCDGAWADETVDRVRLDDGPASGTPQQADASALQAIVSETRDVAESTWPTLRSTDVMHTDLHGGNVLVDSEGRITAVVDWEGARVGDWRWDLAMLAWFHDSPEHPVDAEAVEFLRSSLVEHTDRSALAFLAAATAQTRLTVDVEWRDPATLARDLDTIQRCVRSCWR